VRDSAIWFSAVGDSLDLLHVPYSNERSRSCRHRNRSITCRIEVSHPGGSARSEIGPGCVSRLFDLVRNRSSTNVSSSHSRLGVSPEREGLGCPTQKVGLVSDGIRADLRVFAPIEDLEHEV
jgi:hypothetical protein